MFNKWAMDSNMILAFLKDANVTGASVDPIANRVTLHLDEGEPDVGFDLNPILINYVLKEAGKELSSNDFTDALKARLEAIQDQVQVDWADVDTNSISYIKNKPDVYLPDNTLRTLLNSLTEDGNGNLLYKGVPADSVQPDWLETNSSHKTFIQNKPTLHEHANKLILDALSTNGTDLMYNGIVVSGAQSDWNQTDNSKPEYIRNKPALYDPANQAVLNSIGVDGNNHLTYNGIAVSNTQQADWNETDNTKDWFIRNKPDVYLPSNALRQVLNGFSEDGNNDLNWRGDRVAFEANVIKKVETVNAYGLVGSIAIGAN